MIIAEALRRVSDRRDLAEDEAEAVFVEVMSGRVEPLLLAALLAALKTKGESPTEIIGAARAMRRAALAVEVRGMPAVDTCGTGGDAANTLNISTAAAVVAAAGGARVAKHGNRAASSRCGSADVLEALGVPIDLAPLEATACLERVGITFLFAPRYHPAMRHAMAARRALGLRTIFNYLGPLTNPARVRRQVIGVPDLAAFERLAAVLPSLDYEHCVVVHGLEGVDEISISGPTRVAEWRAGHLSEREVRPQDFGFSPRSLSEVRGGEPAENAAAIVAVLAGGDGTRRGHAPGGPGLRAASDIVALNAGCAFYVAGVSPTWEHGVERARAVLDEGAGLRKLEEWIRVGASLGQRDHRTPGTPS
jgi:anthranilate phosphoribosyltransferase